jgi:hypothetical protein
LNNAEKEEGVRIGGVGRQYFDWQRGVEKMEKMVYMC